MNHIKIFKTVLPFLIFVLIFSLNAPQLVKSYHDPIQILVIVDDDYGANAPQIINKFKNFGWNVTVASLKHKVTSCLYIGYVTMNTDILIPEISDVTVFDAVSVLPGASHVNLLSSQPTLDLIKAADEVNLVISGWCKAVRVLAYADVLDGHNVTGHASYVYDYESAGANYIGESPPVIDGNIVTSVRSTYYQKQTCFAIGKAIGVYEANLPVLGDSEVIYNSTNPKLVTVNIEIFDESELLHAKLRVFEINTTSGERLSPFSSYYESLIEIEPGLYSTTINMKEGYYEVDLMVSDIYYNEFYITNYTQIEVIGDIEETAWNLSLMALISIPILAIIVHTRRK